MKPLTMYALILVLAIFIGCEYEQDHDHDNHNHNDGTALTLDNCESSFGLGVGPFYSTYFSCVDVVVSGNNTAITFDNFPPHESWYCSTTDENYIDFVSQGTGYYHYHPSTKGPLEVLYHKGLIQTPTVGSGEIELYGMMCDGTVILGCTELDGSVPSNSDFDA